MEQLLKDISLNEVSSLKFYLDAHGKVFWDEAMGTRLPLRQLPKKFQIPFLLKFIQNHDLAERFKFIENPLVCIEMYIKANYLLRQDLDSKSIKNENTEIIM